MILGVTAFEYLFWGQALERSLFLKRCGVENSASELFFIYFWKSDIT